MAASSGSPVPFGRYRLLRKLAKGGMAELFLALEANGQPCVIKRVLPNLSSDTEFLTMFLDEARIAAQLSHPSIVRIQDLGLEQGHLYIAMEYIDGFDLEKLCKVKGDLVPPEIAARAGAQVCNALFYANRMTDLSGQPLNIVHRDVTPGNVMITRRGAVKLVDFGIAKATAQLERTRPGIVKGKFRYMSPEQVRQKEIDGRSDLFSLGVVLYEVTTGQKPFERPQVIDTIRAIAGFDPPPPTEVVPGFPKRLSDVIVQALQKDPGNRFRDAQEMQQALESALSKLGPNSAWDLASWACGVMKVPVDMPPPGPPAEATQRGPPAIPEPVPPDATAAMSGAEVRRLIEAADKRALSKSMPKAMPPAVPAGRAPGKGWGPGGDLTPVVTPTLALEEERTAREQRPPLRAPPRTPLPEPMPLERVKRSRTGEPPVRPDVAEEPPSTRVATEPIGIRAPERAPVDDPDEPPTARHGVRKGKRRADEEPTGTYHPMEQAEETLPEHKSLLRRYRKRLTRRVVLWAAAALAVLLALYVGLGLLQRSGRRGSGAPAAAPAGATSAVQAPASSAAPTPASPAAAAPGGDDANGVAKGILEFEGPAGITVEIDGKPSCITPCAASVAPGPHALSASGPKAKFKKTIEVAGGRTVTVPIAP